MDKKSRFFELLAVSVAAGQTIRAAAVVVGCGESLAYKLTGHPDFQSRVAELQAEAAAAVFGTIAAAAGDAVGVLRAITNDTNAKPGDRIAAAKSILALMIPAAEHSRKLAKIEQNEREFATTCELLGLNKAAA